jgi:peptidoglycan/LPS O-acetylase OafA/YrhL
MMFHLDFFFLPQGLLGQSVPFLGRAYLGVDLFFLMSGFVMTHVYGQKLASGWRAHWVDFAIVRFARLYPLFALATLLMVATATLSQMPLTIVSLSGQSLVLQPVMLQYLGSGLSWNYPAWSISTETAAYVLFVFCAGVLVRGKYPRLLAAGCLLVVLSISIAHGGRLNVFSGIGALLRTLAEFTLGALLYRAHRSDMSSSRLWLAWIALVCFFLAAFTHWDVLTVVAFACLIYYGVHTSSALGRVLSSRPAIALGAWSYSIYLLHAPTHYALMAICEALGYPLTHLDATSAKVCILVTALAVVGLSALTFNYFELPMRRWVLRRLLPSRQTVAQPLLPLAPWSLPELPDGKGEFTR